MRKFLTLLLCLLVTPVSAQSWIANASNQSIPFNNNGYLGYINWTNGCILTYQTGTASGTTGGFPVCTTAAITASMLAPGAAAANLNAGGLLKPSITSARTLAMLGDSITFNVDDANLTNGPCVGLSCEAYGYGGYGTWASVYSGYRVWRAPNTGNCGESGGTIAQILANISCVTALNPDVVIYEGGGNDPGSGSTCASATAANRAIYSAFKAAGIAVIKVGIYPRTSPVAFTTSQASIAQCLNMEDRRYAQEVGGAGWYFVDVEPIMVDPAQTGSWATRSGYMLADGAHPSTVGSSAIG
jgi:lysophospholipase L1-like esterase